MSMNCEKRKDLMNTLKKDATAVALSAGTVVGGTAPAIVFASKVPIEPVDRIMKKAGTERVSEASKAELAAYLEGTASEVAEEANNVAKSAKRKTVKAEDIKLEAFR